jgi:putative ABC transport system permease protein
MITKIAFQNMLHRPLSWLLSWLLLAAGIAIISLLLLLQKQLESKVTRSIDGVDMVLGAKGSPLQLILSAVYHADSPTGNIQWKEAKPWTRNPQIAKAIPMAYGDSYKGFSIVGTDTSYIGFFKASCANGRLFEKDFEAVAGANVVAKTLIKTGDQFFSAHGSDAGGEEHKEHAYTLTGVLAPTGTAIDNVVICSMPSVWKMHDHHDHAEEENTGDEKTPDASKDADEADHDHDHDGHADHDHADHAHDHEVPEEEREITAMLIKCRGPMAALTMPRLINDNTKMQAAVPAIEINRMFSLLGVGFDGLKKMGWGILLLSGFSVFIALYNNLRARRYELALMRTMGAGRLKLFWLVLLESWMLCLAGFWSGFLLCRALLPAISGAMEQSYKFSLDRIAFVSSDEWKLLAATLILGFFAALIPAWKAYSIDISKTLSHA